MVAEPARPDPALYDTPPILHWFPNTNNGTETNHQGPRAMDNNGEYLWVGGEFTTVDKHLQQGLTRFGTMAVTTDTGKPESIAKPNVEKPDGTSGTVEVTWTQAWDRDNRNLTYEVILDAKTVVHSVEAGSRFWDLRTMTYTDTGLGPGTVHTYSIRAVDPFGNRIWSVQSDLVSG